MRWRFTLSCLFFLLIGSSSSLTQASHLGVGDAANEGCQCHAYSSATEIFLEGIPQRFESNATLNVTLRIESDIELNEGNHAGGFRLEYIGEGSIGILDEATTQFQDGYLTHTVNGSMHRSWQFEWKTPENNSTIVEFKIFANAVNGNNQPTGDGWSSLSMTVPGVSSNEDFNANTSQEVEIFDLILLACGLVLLGYLLWTSFRSN